jgi:hypothetical protein
VRQRKTLLLNPVNCRYWRTFPSKTQLQPDAGNPPPNGVSSSLKIDLLLLNHNPLPLAAKPGDSNVTGKTMFLCGLKPSVKPRNGSAATNTPTTTVAFLLVFTVYPSCWFGFARNKSNGFFWISLWCRFFLGRTVPEKLFV